MSTEADLRALSMHADPAIRMSAQKALRRHLAPAPEATALELMAHLRNVAANDLDQGTRQRAAARFTAMAAAGAHKGEMVTKAAILDRELPVPLEAGKKARKRRKKAAKDKRAASPVLAKSATIRARYGPEAAGQFEDGWLNAVATRNGW